MVVAELFTSGDHEPVMLLVEVVGNERDVPEQIAATGSKVVVVGELTVTVALAVEVHTPLSAVTV